MKLHNRYFIVILFLSLSISYAKRAITFKDILKFEDMKSESITDNGKWITYRLDKQRGNNNFVIQSTENNKKYIIENGNNAQYSEDTKWFAIKKDIDVIKQLNPNKYKNEKQDLELINTSNDNRETISGVSGYSLAKNGKWLVYTKSYDKKDKQKGKKLILRHLASETEIPIENVIDFVLDSLGNNIFYSTLIDKGLNGLYERKLNEEYAPEKNIETDSTIKYTNLKWNQTLNELVYLKGKIFKEEKTKDNSVNIYDYNTEYIELVADTSSRNGWYIPEINDIRFSEDNVKLWFGFKPLSEYYSKPKDTTEITKDNLYDTDLILDKTELYLWHPKDPEIITEQINEWDKIKDEIYYSIYDINKKKLNYLTDSNEKGVNYSNNPNYTLQQDFEPYKRLVTYSGWYQDLYCIDINNGGKTLIVNELEENPSLSPNGTYTVYFKDKIWYSHNNKTNTTIKLNDKLEVPFYDVLDDHPKEPGSYGIKGWIGKDEYVIIKDQFDLWKFDLSNGKSDLITKGFGRNTENAINIINMNRDKKWFNNDDKIIVNLYGIKNKERQLGILDLTTGKLDVKTSGEFLYNFHRKAKYSDKVIITKEGFNTYPDLWLTDTLLTNFQQITHLQSQVDSFYWGNAYLIDYVTEFGDTLQGSYALPENYQKGKKYPVFVYFYERFSNKKNEFNMPKVNHRPPYSLYLGSDYVMFFPDIKFYDGIPGKSAEVALIAGCNKLVEMGIADPKRIVLHGHSWSGYESAYIVTQTNYFAACISGAPVANMTSAYSGIRLGSGLARQFQYEKEQSRIGGNLIDSLDSYIRNSPVFFANKMNTPLLISFGDRDDAVPWEQGIELYLAMRRFDKNCILLQYEDEPHHLKKIENQLDYSIRMKQFMDYYVFGGKMPEWMLDGFRYKGSYNIGR